HALGDVLGEIADALEVVGEPQRRHDVAQIDRHGLTPRDGQDRLLLDLALQLVRVDVDGTVALGQSGVALGEGADAVSHLLSFSAAPPISVTLRAISCRSTSKALAVCSDIMLLSSRSRSAGKNISRSDR